MKIKGGDLKRISNARRGGRFGLSFIIGIIGLVVSGSNLVFNGKLLGLNIAIPALVMNILLLLVSLTAIILSFQLNRRL